MNTETLDALRRVINYNWADELRDFEENGEPEEGHVFTDLRDLDAWLESRGARR